MSKLDTALTTFILLVYIGAFTPSKFQQGQDGGDDPARKIGATLLTITAPILLLLVYRNFRRFLETLRCVTWPLLLLSLVTLSYFWSVNPSNTLRKLIVFLMSAVFAVYLASLGSDSRDRLIGWAAAATVVISYFIVILLPAYGVAGTLNSEWRGVFDHKNLLGRQMVFTFFLALYSNAFQSRTVARLIAFFAFFLLIMSRSGTSILTFAVVLVFALLLEIRSYLARREIAQIFWLIVVPTVLVVAFVGLSFRSELFALLGKDESLTGRTTIWAVALEGISQRPLLGWGYEAFYTQAELANYYPRGGFPNHSHDGFLDVIMATGYIGFAVFLIGYFIAFRNAWRDYKDTSDRSAQWPLLFLVFFVFINLTESNLLRRGTFLWVPYMAFALWGTRSARLAASIAPEPDHQALPVQAVSA